MEEIPEHLEIDPATGWLKCKNEGSMWADEGGRLVRIAGLFLCQPCKDIEAAGEDTMEHYREHTSSAGTFTVQKEMVDFARHRVRCTFKVGSRTAYIGDYEDASSD